VGVRFVAAIDGFVLAGDGFIVVFTSGGSNVAFLPILRP